MLAPTVQTELSGLHASFDLSRSELQVDCSLLSAAEAVGSLNYNSYWLFNLTLNYHSVVAQQKHCSVGMKAYSKAQQASWVGTLTEPLDCRQIRQ